MDIQIITTRISCLAGSLVWRRKVRAEGVCMTCVDVWCGVLVWGGLCCLTHFLYGFGFQQNVALFEYIAGARGSFDTFVCAFLVVSRM